MPWTEFSFPEKYEYQNGFGSYHETEAVTGALPVGANSPQQAPYGLYAEKLSGTAFTAPRASNLQSWLYRILPSAAHRPFVLSTKQLASFSARGEPQLTNVPNQLRWNPFDIDGECDFLGGLQLVGGAGSAALKTGLAIYVYGAGRSMAPGHAFHSADGDLLLVAQKGVLDIRTELGHLLLRPHEIVIVPRGIRFRVDLPVGSSRGYVLELFQGHFQLPELGPIGSNGLANARDFQTPVASYEDEDANDNNNISWTITAKFDGRLFDAAQDHTPFDVVAWHGNYAPYKYDLGRFNTIGSISFDHPDPSIFTVLTAPSPVAGTAVTDFVIFPPRWLVAEGTFRPPWYHRNTMSEFMGLISGEYDAKAGGKGGFQPGGASLHNVMGSHGPDIQTFERASSATLAPHKVGAGSMAFMFESSLMLGATDWALTNCEKVQELYNEHSWGSLIRHFTPPVSEARRT
ncbi:homogentisate-dioxygenase [Grosmannia clavigera kw1407]|uniref:homogentisate 1,2-dioxygenase n=1 Tax=Grosmannia clavigera (strain kw1407 / UAMH 11150) TaxID=655863 RepID=F0XQY5_GROCL|nr:homogentisate-dioxygenase [Grosmannia clavigera kw1407]EFW99703.1 homogentisate-dioxygenase [Grosmannia clavigera kw1407]